LRDAREQAAASKAADEFATSLTGELSQLQGFTKEHGPAIAEEVKRIIAQYPKGDPRTDTPEFLEAATFRAYTKVVLPTLTRQAQSAQLDTLQRTAAASSGINPGSAAPTSPRKVTSFDDPSLKW
jgi:cell envelope opacity-associated protein A